MTTYILIINLVISSLLILAAVPLLMKRVPPNGTYGIRTPESLASPENWYRINHYGGKQLVLWGTASLFAALLGFFLRIEKGSPLFWGYIFLPMGVVLMARWLTVQFARRF